MKCSKLLLGLVAASAFTAASASVSCETDGQPCEFAGDNSLVTFDVKNPPEKQTYTCTLSTSDNSEAKANVRSAQDAQFKPTVITTNEAVSLIVMVPSKDLDRNGKAGKGEIRFNLQKDKEYADKGIKVSIACQPADVAA